MRRSLAGLGLAAVLLLAFVAQGGTSAQSAPETSTLGMRPSGGFLKPDRLQQYESLIDRQIVWYVAFADRDGTREMRSSVFGQMRAEGATLPPLADRMNLVMTVPLAFGRANPKTAAGKIQVAENLRETASGAHDEHYRVVAQNLIAGGYGDAVIRLGHEATGNWYPWSAVDEPELYKAAFRHVQGVFAQVSPDFRFEWNVALMNFERLGIPAYPGDDVVDIMGMDVYHRPANTGRPLDDRMWERRYMRNLAAHRDFAISRGKPVAYSEWAVGTAEDPAFIDQMAAWFQSLPARGPGRLAYQIYWNTNESRFNLDLYPQNRAAYLRNFGSGAAASAPRGTEPPGPTTTAAPAPPTTTPSPGEPSPEPTPVPSTTVGLVPSVVPVVDVRARPKDEGTGGEQSVGIRVDLSEPTDRPVTVRLAVEAGTATDGVDFYGRTDDLVIPAGETSAWLGVIIVGDAEREADETIRVSIVAVDGAVVGRDSGVLTIVDDD